MRHMSTSSFQRAAMLFLMVILTACGGGESGDAPAHATKISILNGAPLSDCSSGGVTINSGTDFSDDLVLQDTEITATQYMCNGQNGTTGAAGTVGLAGVNGMVGLTGTSGLTAPDVISYE